MRFAEALELEVKKVTFRGVRMSRAQRRQAATASQPMYLSESDGDKVGPNVRMTHLSASPNSVMGYVGDAARAYTRRYGVTSRDLSGPLAPAARVNSRAAKASAKRLAAMGIGPAKPSKRMKAIQRARAEFLGARGRLRDFISANRRGG